MGERAWFVEALRATLFPAVAPRLSPREWWELVAGKRSDDLVVNEGPSGHASAFATVDDGKALLQLVCTTDRIDWGYSIGMGADESGALAPARKVSVAEGTSEFLTRIGRWLPHAPVCRRVAIGAVYRAPAASKEEGYEILREQLRTVEIDPTGSSDFLYRINRPRESKCSPFPLIVNRVAQWNVATFQGQPTSPVETLATVHLPMKSTHYCRIELDCNTAADNSELIENPHIEQILRELSDLAIEITHMGDIR